MKKDQLKYNRIPLLFSLITLSLLPFIGKAQLRVNSTGYVGLGVIPTSGLRLTAKGTGLYTAGTHIVALFTDGAAGAAGRGIVLGYNANGTSADAGIIRVANNGLLALNPLGGNVTFGGSTMTTNSYVYINSTAGAYQSALAFQSAGVTQSTIYKPASSNDLRFYNIYAGDVMSITQAGNVGIGITNPSFDLQLFSNSAAKPTSSTWTIASDQRTKRNIASYAHALDLVRQVKIVTYQYNGLANTPDGENGVGVIAQDFQRVFPNSVKSFSVKDSSGTNETFLGVDLHELFVANVGAVKELDSIVSTQNSALKGKVDSLTNQLAEVLNQIRQLASNMNACCERGASKSSTENTTVTDVTLNNSLTIVLEQNVPNPFAEQTSINYFLPDNTVKAQMLFHNSQGLLIQSVDLIQKGNGMLNVFAQDLTSGIYSYTLVVDGKIIETKKMVKQ